MPKVAIVQMKGASNRDRQTIPKDEATLNRLFGEKRVIPATLDSAKTGIVNFISPRLTAKKDVDHARSTP